MTGNTMINSITMLLCLTMLSVGYLHAATTLERVRLAVSHRRAATMLGVFTFAAVVLLSPLLLTAFVPLVYLAAWPTFHRAGQKAPKWAYSAMAATAGCLVSSVLLHTVPRMLSLPAAVAGFMLINLAIVAVPIVIERDRRSLTMLAKPRTHQDVLAGQVLGAAVGVSMQWHPVVGILGLPLLVALHRRSAAATVTETEAYIDGVWAQDAWTALAEEAHRLGQWFSILLVDLDDLAEIVTVASVLTDFIEPGDSLGRLGPSHLVMLLDEATASGARVMARQIAAALSAAGVHAGVGSADCHRATVHQMLVLAAGDAVVQGASAPRPTESV